MINALKFTTNSKTIISMKGSKTGLSLEYSYDGIDWKEWDFNGLTINSGDILYIRGNNPNGFNRGSAVNKYCSFEMNGGKVRCYGNIMSLIDYKNLPNIIPCEYCFYGLFKDCTALTTAPELPATKLAKGCYCSMFEKCTSLKIEPALPATTLKDSCYYRMFFNCTSLTVAPELPAQRLANFCYCKMFYSCTSLKIAPELPTAELTIGLRGCYDGMFYGCTSLKNKPELTESSNPIMTFKEYCQRNVL